LLNNQEVIKEVASTTHEDTNIGDTLCFKPDLNWQQFVVSVLQLVYLFILAIAGIVAIAYVCGLVEEWVERG
jgi:hypothetical protein